MEDSKELLRMSIQIQPSEVNYTNLGWIHHKEGNYEQAIECYDKALAIKPHYITKVRKRKALKALKSQ